MSVQAATLPAPAPGRLPTTTETPVHKTAEQELPLRPIGRAATALRFARRIPVTVGVLAVLVFFGIRTGTLWHAVDPESDLLRALSFGTPRLRDGQLWTFATGAFVLPRPEFYPLVGAILLVGLGGYERRLGSARAAAALFGTQIIGAASAALILLPFQHSSWSWAATLTDHVDLGLSAGALGVGGAATALFSETWRRRVRFCGQTYLVVLLLRSGLLWDVEHLMAFSTGMVFGPALAGRPRLHLHRPRIDSIRIRSCVAILVASVAVANVVDAAYPGLGGIFGSGLPSHTPMHAVGRAVAELAVVLLIADALRRGRAAAWWVAITGTFVVLVNSWASTRDVICAATVLLLLATYRNTWRWRTPDGFARRSLRRVAIAMAAFGTVWVVLIWALRAHFTPTPDLLDMLREAMARMTFDVGPLTPTGGSVRFALAMVTMAWALTMIVLLSTWMYADRGPDGGSRERLGRLLRRHGGGSLGWMRTWPAFSTWTTRDAQSAISYCVVGPVAIAIGDPVGPDDQRATAIAEFRQFCRYAGWTPCWFAATAAFLAAADDWQAVQIGEDTVIDLTTLQFVGKPWQDVRTARNRAAREGITMLTGRLADFPQELREQIERISQEWVSGKALPEMGFTLGTVTHALDPEMLTHVAVDRGGAVQGITTWLPVHQDCEVVGWTLDLMRRRPNGFRPVMEYLIAESAMLFKEKGYRTVSLSVAPLARRSQITARRGVLDRGLDVMSRLLEPTYGFQSLLAFKAKFQPIFTPVYLVYSRPADLLAISVAISRAYLPTVDTRQAAGLLLALRRSHPREGVAR